MTRRYRLLLNGCGRVGQAFARLIVERSERLADRYDIELELVAITASSRAWVAARSTSSLSDVLRHVEAGATLEACDSLVVDAPGLWAIEHVEAEILVEATPTNLRDGEPATTHVRRALDHGLHVVSAAKGPLVHHLHELRSIADQRGVQLGIGAATAAALPTVDLADACLAGAEVLRFEGILNGTSNEILTQLGRGVSYADALADAQRRGIAEADPTLDVGGHDTAAKLVLIAGSIWGADLRLADLPVTGITEIVPDDLRVAARDGGSLKLLGSAWRDESGVHAHVQPTRLEATHPLAHVDGTEKGATFLTDTMDRVTVIGGKSDPVGAAAALLRDVIRIAR